MLRWYVKNGKVCIESVPDLTGKQLIRNGDLYLAIPDSSPFLIADGQDAESITEKYIEELENLGISDDDGMS